MGRGHYNKYKINETYPDGSIRISYYRTQKIAEWNMDELRFAFPDRSYNLVRVV